MWHFNQLLKKKSVPDTSSPMGGYNLLMTAMSLIIIGVIASAALQAYSIYAMNERVTTNQLRVSNAITILQNYKEVNGRYPCPAPLDAARTAPAYGYEDCTTVIANNTCTNGICSIQGRTIAPSVVPSNVRIGTIPFRLLQLNESDTFDAYGSRIVYAVTESQTSPATYNELNGAINIVDESGQAIVEPAGSANFVVISQGPDHYGAYSSTGAQSSACTAGTSEAANCINLATPPTAPLTFVSSMEYLAGAATQFDDTIEYFSNAAEARWRRNTASIDDIQTLSNSNVGVSLTTPGVALDIAQATATGNSSGKFATWDGALRATGVTKASKICDISGTMCFEMADFESATPPASMNCGSATSRKYVVGLQGDGTGNHAAVRCDYVRTTCPAGQVIAGFNTTSGAPICIVAALACSNTASIQICNSGGSFNILPSDSTLISNPTGVNRMSWGATPASPSSGVYVSPVPANTSLPSTSPHSTVRTIFDPTSYSMNLAYAAFTCNNGVWQYNSGTSHGLCSACTPTAMPSGCVATGPGTCTITTNPACSTWNACITSGTYTSTTTYTYNSSTCTWGSSSSSSNAAAVCTTCPIAPSTGVCSTGIPWCGYSGFASASSPIWDTTLCKWNSACTCNTPTVPTQSGNNTSTCGSLIGGSTGSASQPWTQSFNSALATCNWNPKVTGAWDVSACTCSGTYNVTKASTCNSTCENTLTYPVDTYTWGPPAGGMVVGATCSSSVTGTTAGTCSPKVFLWSIIPSSPPTMNVAGTTGTKGECGVTQCNTTCLVSNVAGSTGTCWKHNTSNTSNYDIYSAVCQ